MPGDYFSGGAINVKRNYALEKLDRKAHIGRRNEASRHRLGCLAKLAVQSRLTELMSVVSRAAAPARTSAVSQRNKSGGINKFMKRYDMAERLLANDLNVNVTYEVYLSGGQRRLKEAVLYVANKSEPMTFFGRVKLNKIIWRADFRSFYGRRQPVTGRTYQKLEWGPALIEMVPVMQGLLREGILVQEARIHAGTKEFRPVAQVEPVLKFFSREDIEYLDESIHHYWDMSGTESSDESHGIAWKSRQIGDLIPYEASYFSDIPLSETALRKLSEIAAKHNLHSG